MMLFEKAFGTRKCREAFDTKIVMIFLLELFAQHSEQTMSLLFWRRTSFFLCATALPQILYSAEVHKQFLL